MPPTYGVNKIVNFVDYCYHQIVFRVDYVFLFFTGILIGILSSAPLGPAGVLCIQRTLNRGRLNGFFSGVGVALADTIFAIVAVYSLSKVQVFVQEMSALLWLAVGTIVVIVGGKIMLTDPVKQLRAKGKQQNSLFGALISIFLLTINPINLLPVLSFTGLFLHRNLDTVWSGPTVVFGVLCGALIWWLFLTTLVAHYRKHFKLRQMWWINKISGAIILFLGALAIIRAMVGIIAAAL
ncbi:MAG: LysE family transporter [Prevotellaceae bacterium]|nr:LysE family transporter [Prevotellaceae bacterium]